VFEELVVEGFVVFDVYVVVIFDDEDDVEEEGDETEDVVVVWFLLGFVAFIDAFVVEFVVLLVF
jgi:hypothetical protein